MEMVSIYPEKIFKLSGHCNTDYPCHRQKKSEKEEIIVCKKERDWMGGAKPKMYNGVYSLKWRLTDRYLRWGSLAHPRPSRAEANRVNFCMNCPSRVSPRFWVPPPPPPHLLTREIIMNRRHHIQVEDDVFSLASRNLFIPAVFSYQRKSFLSVLFPDSVL